ncbi:glycosyltransferase [Thiothrix fructosivorans]|jgi:glycosyltransferase involved in cell wall biosynthesis|uniref:Glycosyltransferase family 2 protein n=1 Tax=Thiothrix fructosivorans TaxID=111770 RepID=A0A8B0SJA8_9GAMM|nr:glycosyltransferase family 2 protein [Thiothrix fructosivorans]MBO0611805.1 glycosyltransferase family 2 protein [Thiothrix fructosivorans]QTX10540.1 glycosyltransferase family 2 protein [Thiothrix fructosivorans]
MASVIVPAHNEASVIRRCLDSLQGQAGLDSLIVACNGCTDNTAEIVRNEYPQAICLDIATPSKVNALNEAEKHVTTWPVFYIDADTHLSTHAIQTVTQALAADQGFLLAAPEPEIDTSRSSWLVKQYYRVWLQLPYIQDGVVATCSYVITQAGRQRFDAFPAVINDDGFVRCQFERQERGNISGAKIFISAPQDLNSLIKIKTRARLGNMQLTAEKLCTKADKKPYSSILLNKLLSREFLPTLVYLSIASFIRWRAGRQYHHLQTYTWEKDQSSRQTN